LVKMAGNRGISRYTAEVIKDFHWYECEIRACQLLEDASNFILEEENEYFSILSSDISERIVSQLPAAASRRQASQRYFPLDSIAPNSKLDKDDFLSL
jgi:hypothetical protein